jgi:DNA mismatch endonuclease, patch repair protein
MFLTDVVDKLTRSRMMSGIRGKDTRPEMRLRQALHALGFRYRLHVKALPGKPDLVLARYRAVIYLHGCFWHRHNKCRLAATPASNADFWTLKFAGNVERDAQHVAALIMAGWRVATVWECGLRAKDISLLMEQIEAWLKSGSNSITPPGIE